MSKSITVKLPDNSQIKAEEGIDLFQLAQKIGPRLAKDAIAGRLDDKLVDLREKVPDKSSIGIITFGTDDIGKLIYWHSTSHVLAQAAKSLFPEIKLGIGPAIDNGFYYDFERAESFSEEDLVKIEQKMTEIIKADLPFERRVLSKDEALKLFKEKGEDYKIELIKELGDEEISIYQQGDFVDLCKGPHIPSTGKIKAVKLLSIAGAYWKGDEKRPMLQRIYGISFPSNKELDEYLNRLEEAKRRDHRLLGKQLDLFHFDEELGPGLPLWHPNGARLRNLIEDYWKGVHLQNGYELLAIPHIAKKDLWVTSGHWDFYRENMYSPMKVDDVDYIVKPMNCPGHILIYKSQTRSYRDLPLKWAEMGTVYRYERSGVLHGLMRVRGFTQDDAHIFCTKEQIEEQILEILKLALKILKTFGFKEYEIFLSTKPEKFVGSDAHWEAATSALEKALKDMDLEYKIDPGEGVFYGPKIDIKIKDAIGRTWQCSTIQVDFNLPQRFDVNFTNRNNSNEQPIMIHRAILGSFERFIGVLIEHYAGAFPVWFSPVQAILLPIATRHDGYANKVADLLKEEGIRVEVDVRTETTSKKVRDAQTQKVPFMLIVGDVEEKQDVVSVRTRDGKDFRDIKLQDFIKNVGRLVENKSVLLDFERV